MFTKIIFAYVLWGAVFKSKHMVAGYTFNTMILYYIISSAITQFDQTSMITNKMSEEVQNGQFSKYLLFPINIKEYYFLYSLGGTVFFGVFSIVCIFIFGLIFQKNLFYNIEISRLGLSFVIVLLGLLFMKEINYAIGILSIKYIDVTVFVLIKDNIIMLITGGLIPLSFFSKNVVRVMKFFPFYFLNYYPTELVITGDTKDVKIAIFVLVAWTATAKIANKVMMTRIRKKYEGVGL